METLAIDRCISRKILNWILFNWHIQSPEKSDCIPTAAATQPFHASSNILRIGNWILHPRKHALQRNTIEKVSMKREMCERFNIIGEREGNAIKHMKIEMVYMETIEKFWCKKIKIFKWKKSWTWRQRPKIVFFLQSSAFIPIWMSWE